MAKEPVVGCSVALPQRHIDALDAAAGPFRSRSSMLAEVVEWALTAGRLAPYPTSAKDTLPSGEG